MLNQKKYPISAFTAFVVDMFLVISSFLLVYWIKRSCIELDEIYLKYFALYLLSWLAAGLVTQKFKIKRKEIFLNTIKPFMTSTMIMVGFLSVLSYSLKLFSLSRFIVFGSVGIFLLFEMALLTFYYLFVYLTSKEERKTFQISILFFVFEILLITVTFLAVYFYKRGDLVLSDDYKILLFIFYFTWLFIGLFTHKFQVKTSQGIIKALWPFIKSYVLMLTILSFFVFAFRIIEFSRLILFGSLSLFALSEWLVVTIYFFYSYSPKTDEIQTNYFHIHELLDLFKEEEIAQEYRKRINKGKYRLPGSKQHSSALDDSLKNIYLKNFHEIYKFIQETIHLESIDLSRSVILRSSDQYNVEVLPDNSLELFFNLHEVNDFRRINQYFIHVNRVLVDGGIFLGKFEPISRRLQRFRSKFPKYLGDFFYLMDFIWRRIFPKLPFFQKIYFAFTKGHGRALSKAEGLGRIYFCGFEILGLKELDSFIYFIVKKIKTPSTDASPSYGPLFKMKRRGIHGKPIYVYKFRTMHPYSEYLQPYMIDLYGYNTRGKVLNDFRVTSWGKFLRKYWLDELPQLINFVKGDMKLVGIRPLSDRFLKEYPKEMLEMRFKYKPGCLPPYVALKKQAVDEYIESERIYLEEKMKHPIWTDIKYFFWGSYNILTNKIRSM